MTKDKGTRFRGINTSSPCASRPVPAGRRDVIRASSSATNLTSPLFAATLIPVARKDRRVCISSPRAHQVCGNPRRDQCNTLVPSISPDFNAQIHKTPNHQTDGFKTSGRMMMEISGQLPVCQLPVCQLPVCQIPVCQIPVCQTPAYQTPACQQQVCLANPSPTK